MRNHTRSRRFDGGPLLRRTNDVTGVSRSDGSDEYAQRTLWRSMLSIALPLALSASVRYGVEFSGAYWVGKLGVAALSIVTGLGTFMSFSKMFAGLTSAGSSAVIGRLIGQGRWPVALRMAQKVTAVALGFGLCIASIGLATAHVALDALSFTGVTRDDAARYLYVQLAGLPFAFGTMAMSGVLVGLGRPRASMLASLASFGVSFVMTPLLLRGAGAGVWAAAFGPIVGDLFGYAVGLRALHALAGAEGKLPWRTRFSNLTELWPILRVGAPLTADAVMHGAVWFGLVAFLSRYGGEYVAAQGAEERLTHLLNVATEGIAPAAATLVGYNLGRGRRREALRAVQYALAVVVAVTFAGAMLLLASPVSVVAWICSDPSFVRVGAQVFTIAAVGLVFLGVRDVLEAAFGGLGNTMPPVIIGLFVAVLRFPLSYALAVRMGYGAFGVAWAVNITLIAQACALTLLIVLRFRRASPLPAAYEGGIDDAPRRATT